MAVTPTPSKFATIIAEIRKALAAATGLVAEGLAVGFLNATDVKWGTIIIGAITTALVYFVPNGKAAKATTVLTNVSSMPPALAQEAPTPGTVPPPHG